MNQDEGRIGWELAASDFIECEEVNFKWRILINAVNVIRPIAIGTIRLPATLYELMDFFGRMHTINGDTMEVVDDGLVTYRHTSPILNKKN